MLSSASRASVASADKFSLKIYYHVCPGLALRHAVILTKTASKNIIKNVPKCKNTGNKDKNDHNDNKDDDDDIFSIAGSGKIRG